MRRDCVLVHSAARAGGLNTHGTRADAQRWRSAVLAGALSPRSPVDPPTARPLTALLFLSLLSVRFFGNLYSYRGPVRAAWAGKVSR